MIKNFITNKCGEDLLLRRKLCGNLSGIVGILLNAILGIVKMLLGIASGSVAIIADAVNNISDAVASLATLIGFKIAHSKGDEEHPFGHARAEYMTGVVVSGLIVAVGIKLVISSYEKIISGTPVEASTISIIILIIMIFAKIWLYSLNMHLSKLIESSSLKATGIDSRNDAITTMVVLLSILIGKISGVNIDGYAGVLVGIFIVFSGLKMLGETASPLLGKKADPRVVEAIEKIIYSHPDVLGLHDLIIHDYGPGHTFASVHIEVDSRKDIFITHEMIDDIEQQILTQLGIQLVGHMDPQDTQDERLSTFRDAIEKTIRDIEGAIDFHDLRLTSNESGKKVFLDVVITSTDAEETKTIVCERIESAICEFDSEYTASLSFDINYSK